MSHWQLKNSSGYAPLLYGVDNAGNLPSGWSWNALDSACYARFQGKLRKGSASMGVTVASWKQSRDMIVSRSNHLRKTVDSAIRHLEGNKGALKRLRKEREPLANQVLEGEFGWKPLFQDMHAALYTVCKDGIPPDWVTSRASSGIQTTQSSSSLRRTEDGIARVTYSAKVDIENPNLWLLNRLGLINPAMVAWDLVPWSYVVNMLVNVNSMIGSVTDEIGLKISNRSVTRTCLLGREYFQTDGSGSSRSYAFERHLIKSKNRELNSGVQPHWQVKVPDFNWELAVIATSLALQRIKKLNNLIRLI